MISYARYPEAARLEISQRLRAAAPERRHHLAPRANGRFGRWRGPVQSSPST